MARHRPPGVYTQAACCLCGVGGCSGLVHLWLEGCQRSTSLSCICWCLCRGHVSAWGKTDAVMNVAFLVVGSPSVLTQEGLACGWVPCLVAGSRWLF